ncbi:MAG: TonB-dependent receptor [Burkholderiales bacterium]|uniref:TonB-dependent receptor domain-containing protein n=1 Tax=Roseateles sp. TaxID=1971397 RepID=UPI000FAE57BB|nr:MAG: TonB-dependent receptor [Burkholderiales bacterium]
MFKTTTITTAVLALAASSALAQEAQKLERIEITGSSIRRVDSESALPVTVLRREDIEKSGFTTATDLIQSLPSMQGFLTTSNSVNGGGGGATNASLHSVGSRYTLVLLNGRRMAPYNTGTTINLESIPLSAVERIEVLTDGASALYGADAIAGVVNFILKKDSTEGSIVASVNKPQRKNGESGNFSITKGFGNVDTDGFNILLSLAGEKQKVLRAEDREYSKSGVGPAFMYNGKLVAPYNTSSNTVPGTVFLSDTNGGFVAGYTPSFYETGKCGDRSFLRNGVCRFDYPSTVDNIPESQRLSFFSSGRLKLNNDHTLFGEFVFSDFKNKPKYAPPAQPGIPLTQDLVNKHVLPLLGQLGLAPTDFAGVNDPNGNGPTMNLRLFDAGGRQDEYRTKTLHTVVGAEGTFGSVDYSTYFTHSENRFTQTLLSGYTSKLKLYDLINTGKFDPLASGIGQGTSILADAVYRGKLFDQSKSTIDQFSLRGSLPVGKLSGGDVMLGAGFDFTTQKYVDNPSDLAMGGNALQPNFKDTPIGGSSGALPFNAKRNSKGVFAELNAPIVKGFELNGAVRYDKYDAVSNSSNFDANGNPISAATQGKAASSATYKVTARFQPIKQVLLRGSYGTGFKAPTLADIVNPLQASGNTGFHACPPGLDPALAAYCKPGSSEYNIIAGGNASSGADGLKPEKSTQSTVGIRIEPDPSLSFGVDWWNVRLKDRINTLPESVTFSDGKAFGAFFTVLPDPVTGTKTLTLIQKPFNQGSARYSGLDFDVSSNIKTPVGKLTTKLALTYMIKSDYELIGKPGYQTSLGQFGPDNNVTFRWLAGISTSLQSGAFTNTFNITLKPSYRDQKADWDPVNGCNTPTCVRAVNPDGTYGALQTVERTVSSYALLDWQIKYAYTKTLAFTFGIRNLFDAAPPLSIQAADGTGNMRGIDPRYADPLGRNFYATVDFKF